MLVIPCTLASQKKAALKKQCCGGTSVSPHLVCLRQNYRSRSLADRLTGPVCVCNSQFVSLLCFQESSCDRGSGRKPALCEGRGRSRRAGEIAVLYMAQDNTPPHVPYFEMDGPRSVRRPQMRPEVVNQPAFLFFPTYVRPTFLPSYVCTYSRNGRSGLFLQAGVGGRSKGRLLHCCVLYFVSLHV